ncbi:MAG: YpdA family putative bacillithiol disulfide reductase [Gemmatimonadetes bacterium]|nr:YpdA family putative bacillithiol disulfide reductase [Gemmatimonadota bacterium]
MDNSLPVDDPQPLDLVIVGAGPCGLAAAVAASQAGLRYEILDKGCITSSLIQYPYYMTFFSTAVRLEIGDLPFTIPEPRPTRQQALAYYRRVAERHGIHVRQHHDVRTLTRMGSVFQVQALHNGEERRFETHAVVVATGGFGEPNYLNVPGGESGRILHYYKEPYPFHAQDVLVVGGANSAVEAALEMHRNGVRVQMVHFNDVFDRGVKPWVRPDIENRIGNDEIVMHWKHRVAQLAPGTVTLRHEDTGETKRLDNDWVLAMTGWRPDRTLMERLGVAVDPETGIPDHDPATMETNVPGVFIAGVIAAGNNANKIFIENGREHGALIVAALGRR